jgi:hypothetical protein
MTNSSTNLFELEEGEIVEDDRVVQTLEDPQFVAQKATVLPDVVLEDGEIYEANEEVIESSFNKLPVVPQEPLSHESYFPSCSTRIRSHAAFVEAEDGEIIDTIAAQDGKGPHDKKFQRIGFLSSFSKASCSELEEGEVAEDGRGVVTEKNPKSSFVAQKVVDPLDVVLLADDEVHEIKTRPFSPPIPSKIPKTISNFHCGASSIPSGSRTLSAIKEKSNGCVNIAVRQINLPFLRDNSSSSFSSSSLTFTIFDNDIEDGEIFVRTPTPNKESARNRNAQDNRSHVLSSFCATTGGDLEDGEIDERYEEKEVDDQPLQQAKKTAFIIQNYDPVEENDLEEREIDKRNEKKEEKLEVVETDFLFKESDQISSRSSSAMVLVSDEEKSETVVSEQQQQQPSHPSVSSSSSLLPCSSPDTVDDGPDEMEIDDIAVPPPSSSSPASSSVSSSSLTISSLSSISALPSSPPSPVATTTTETADFIQFPQSISDSVVEENDGSTTTVECTFSMVKEKKQQDDEAGTEQITERRQLNLNDSSSLKIGDKEKNIGWKLLMKCGYNTNKKGNNGLGKYENGRIEPLSSSLPTELNRRGLGSSSSPHSNSSDDNNSGDHLSYSFHHGKASRTANRHGGRRSNTSYKSHRRGQSNGRNRKKSSSFSYDSYGMEDDNDDLGRVGSANSSSSSSMNNQSFDRQPVKLKDYYYWKWNEYEKILSLYQQFNLSLFDISSSSSSSSLKGFKRHEEDIVMVDGESIDLSVVASYSSVVCDFSSSSSCLSSASEPFGNNNDNNSLSTASSMTTTPSLSASSSSSVDASLPMDLVSSSFDHFPSLEEIEELKGNDNENEEDLIEAMK